MDGENITPQIRNTKRRCAKQSLVLLPEEITEEIISRLPVKSLLRLRSVSKSWHSLIGSERFIKTHLQNSTKHIAFSRNMVILQNYGLQQCSLHSLLNDDPISPFPMYIELMEDCRISGVINCCNGMVCIVKSSENIILWNPSTRIFNKLPKVENSYLRWDVVRSGLGWDESSGAYKVFAVVLIQNIERICKVYSSKTGSWKTVSRTSEERNEYLFNHIGQYFDLSGKLHWLRHKGGKEADVVTFEWKSEMFGTMELPCYPMAWDTLSLGVLGGCLSVAYDNDKGLDVWVMKQNGNGNGVKESWCKVIAHIPLLHRFYYSSPAPFCVTPNGQIVLTHGPNFLVYDPKYNVLSPHKSSRGFVAARLCVESLVSPLFVNN